MEELMKKLKIAEKYNQNYSINEIIKILEQEDQRIAELEQNCAEYPFKQGIYDYQDEIDQLKQQLAEKDKEIEKLKQYADYRFEVPYGNVTILGKSIEDIQWLTNSWLRQGGKQLAIQELEKVKASADKWFDFWENSKYEGNRYDKLDVSNAYLQMSCEIDQQIKELKGEKDAES